MRALPVAVCALVLACAIARPAAAQSGANVLVVANASSPDSSAIASYYAGQRGVPPDQVLSVAMPAAEEISRADYVRAIEQPVGAWLGAHSAQDRILYIVLIRGVPLKIAGTPGRTGTAASVDSELALLYRRLLGVRIAAEGPVPNPYFDGDRAAADVQPFSHRVADIYLVTRLDGFTASDARALVDRSMSAVASGRIVLDGRPPATAPPVSWLAAAAQRLAAAGFPDRVVLDSTSQAATVEGDVIGYSSLGSNDPALTARKPAVQFAPGALVSMFLSSDARTMSEPPANWRPGSFAAPFAGSSQSLVADMVRAGATGVAGQVSEAYLDGAVRPDVLFPGYLQGLNLAEAFYRAIPFLGWHTVVVGDPLCAPARKQPLPPADLDPPLDPDTDLPSAFSDRRLAVLAGATASLPARKLLLRGETRAARNDVPGAIASFEQAVAIDPAIAAGWRALGLLYEQSGDAGKSLDAFRKVLALDPGDVIALNNVAYSLAVKEHRPSDALPLAEQAFSRAPGNSRVADTLAWVRHLAGDDAGAIAPIEAAVRAAPRDADLQLHAAVIYAATGRVGQAAAALKTALALDPAVEKREEYRAVRQKLGGATAKSS